jgi:putative transposase
VPRPRRLLPAGFVYHIVNRANERSRIFAADNDFERFLDLMRETSERVALRICAFCIMPTHWHLVVWPSFDGAVSAYVHHLCTLHAVQHRHRQGSVGHGHVYQGRFRSFPVEGSRYYFNVLRYVEANPLRAGLVDRAEAWPWSSLHDRAHGSTLVTPGPLALPENWTDIVNAQSGLGELDDLRACARSSRPYGSGQWITETTRAQGLEQTTRPRGRPRREPPPDALKATPGIALSRRPRRWPY